MPGVPLFNARVEDLAHAETVEVKCLVCGHRSQVLVGDIRAKIPDWYRVLDLPRVLRCDHCRSVGRSMIHAKEALGYGKTKD